MLLEVVKRATSPDAALGLAQRRRSRTLREVLNVAAAGDETSTTAFKARWPWRLSALRPLAFSGTEKETLPAESARRTSLPTPERKAPLTEAREARLASRSTSSRAPAPAGEMRTEPRTA